MSQPFCNNLRKGDPVMHGSRKAFVHAQPREQSTQVQVLYIDRATPAYVPVEDLRLIVDGVPEEVPPYDGDLPRAPAKKLTPYESQRPFNSEKAIIDGVEWYFFFAPVSEAQGFPAVYIEINRPAWCNIEGRKWGCVFESGVHELNECKPLPITVVEYATRLLQVHLNALRK